MRGGVIREATVLTLVVGIVVSGKGRADVLAWYSFNSAGRECVSPGQKLSGSMAQSIQGRGVAGDLRGYWGFWYGFGAAGGIVGTPAPSQVNLAIVPSILVGNRATLRCYSVGTGPVDLAVFDAVGRCILARRTVATEDKLSVPLDFGALPGGVYVVRLKANGSSASQKLVVNREE